jgi:hypothetical protein
MDESFYVLLFDILSKIMKLIILLTTIFTVNLLLYIVDILMTFICKLYLKAQRVMQEINIITQTK